MDGQSHALEKLIIDQSMNLVLLRETLGYTVAVLPCPLGKVARYADVQGTVALACQNINGWLLGGHRSRVMDSHLRGNAGEEECGNDP